MWGEPSERPKLGDIESFSYVFIGGFVGRGTKSVETILLLLALKVKYPDAIYLTRGQTEDKPTNHQKGLFDECGVKFQEDSNASGSIFNRLNGLFEYLPLCAVIADTILCVHGGIGQTWRTLEELETVQRPLSLNRTSTDVRMKLAIDAVFSDPSDSDRRSVRDPTGLKYSGERVGQFLTENRLGMVIRSHEPVMEGYDRVFDGKVMTVFSATDYCGKYRNAAALLLIKRTLEIVPKTLNPIQGQTGLWLESEGRNPPTPPRAKNK
jgi:diadenosine tetraphosphatase ApaH/serine/threonine PP2A family protein phosphatase